MGKEKRRYSDEDRSNALAALAANSGNISRTAEQLEIPAKTLENWAKGISHPEAAKNGERKKQDLAVAFDEIAWRCLDNVTEEKLKKTGAVDLLKTAGIAVDKAQLLRGKPTQITSDTISLIEARQPREDSTADADPAETSH